MMGCDQGSKKSLHNKERHGLHNSTKLKQMNKLTEKTDYTPLPWMPQPVEFEPIEKDTEVDYDFSADIGGYDGLQVCTYVKRALVMWEDDSTTEVDTEELAYLFPRDQWEEWETIDRRI